jgi:hypothetical protein
MCGCINDYVPGLQREFDFEKMCDTDMDISHMNCTHRLITLSQQREAVTKELAMDEEAEAAAQEWLEGKLRKKAENRQRRLEAKEAKKAQEFDEDAETWARTLVDNGYMNDAMDVIECTEEESEEECDARQSANELSYADHKKSLDAVKKKREELNKTAQFKKMLIIGDNGKRTVATTVFSEKVTQFGWISLPVLNKKTKT